MLPFCVLGELIDTVVRPFVLNTEFQLKGYFIEPSKVKRLLITESEGPADVLVQKRYSRMPVGTPATATEQDCAFNSKELSRDITSSVMAEVKKEVENNNIGEAFESRQKSHPRYKSIFVAYSYRTKDDELVSGFKELLADKGFKVIDGKADQLGSISQAILEKIGISDLVAIVMTRRDKKENGQYTTTAWLLEEKGAAVALGKEVAMFVEEGVDQNDIGGLQGDAQRFNFTRNNFLKNALNFVKIIEL